MQIAFGMILDQMANQPKSIQYSPKKEIHEQSETFPALSKGISHLKDPLGSVLVKEESPKE